MDSCLLQVNSDVVYYKKDKYGNMTPFNVDTTYIGLCLYTKAIGSTYPLDITITYKYPEGNVEAEPRLMTGVKPPPDFKGQHKMCCVYISSSWEYDGRT